MNAAAKLPIYISSINLSSVLMTLMVLKRTSIEADESSLKVYLENFKLKLQLNNDAVYAFYVVFNSAQTNRVEVSSNRP